MPETLTPITREETYLAAIAGEDVTVPDPVTRHEEFLAAIDGHVDSVEQDVTDLAAIVPTPAAADEGKVLTAGSTAGTASWANVPKELPASLGTAGQVLTVNAGATGVEWATPSGGGGGTVITVGAATSAGNAANYAIFDNGTELTTYTAVHNYMADKYDKQIVFLMDNGGVYVYLYPLQFADVSAAQMCVMSCLAIGDQTTEIDNVGFVPAN